ncbi:MAG TPA: response regulator transcription factor [Acidimicrobiia bacterium]|nr:response regulator transcription factor [Acidimicrobiia bacterium]
MIRLLIADDQALVRAGFRSILDSDPQLEVTGEAATGREAVAAAKELEPDIVLMDIRMPDLDGIEATRSITSDPDLANTKVIVVTTFELDEYVFGSLRAGASGFLLKDVEPDDLIQAVKIVHAGDALLSPSVTRRLVAEFVNRTPEPRTTQDLDILTDREKEVVALVAGGLTNQEIADRLFISTNTAKTHVSRAMVKLGVHDRAQLVVLAYQSGLVVPEES